MSTTIDQKVVEMKFDNRNFESNVGTTMSTLDKLKEKLKFKGSTKSLEDLDKASKGITFATMSNGIDGVKLKISALGVMATTTIANITNQAVNAGKKLVSAFTIDPVKTGFQEYETQINAVQTILANTASKGTTLEDVNKALDELNTYADKTIYNFTEMTRNIGTFTAAGVNLKTSTAAIQGIANLAAVSGSNAQQASTAMYQLSQALASGAVKLQDWNSVVNAGMGGEVFQNALKETARLHGVAIDQMIKDEGSFRDSLKNGWVTTEVLTETLNKFTTTGVNEYLAQYSDLSLETITSMRKQATASSDVNGAFKEMAVEISKTSKLTESQVYELLSMSNTAEEAATKVKTFTQLMDTLKEAVQSGWTQTWEILIGDFGEAKILFTEISDAAGAVISEISNARNNLLEGAMSSGWSQLRTQIEATGIPIEKLQNAFIETAKAHGIAIDEFIKQDGNFENTLKRGWLTSDMVSGVLGNFADYLSDTSGITKQMADDVSKLGIVVDDVIAGKFGKGEEQIKALTDAGYDYNTIQQLVTKRLNGETISIENLSEAQLNNLGYTKDQIKKIGELAQAAKTSGTPINEMINNMTRPSGRELIIDTFRNAIKGLSTSLSSLKQAWINVFPPITSEQLYIFIDKIHELSKGFLVNEKNAEKLRITFEGFLSIIKIITTITGGAFKFVISVIGDLIGNVNFNVLDLTSSIGSAIVNFRKFITENETLTKAFSFLVKITSAAVLVIKNLITEFLELPQVQNILSKISTTAINAFDNFGKYVDYAITKITEFVESIKTIGVGKTFENLFSSFTSFGKNVKNVFGGISKTTEDASDNVKKTSNVFKIAYDIILSKTSAFGSNFINIFNTVVNKIKEINLGTVVALIFSGGLLLFLHKVDKMIAIISNSLSFLADIKNGILGVLGGFKNVLNSYATNLKSEALIKVAIAVGILAAAMTLISFIPDDKLIASGVALISLAGAITLLAASVALISKFVKIEASVGALLGLATAMLLIVASLEKLNDMPADTMTKLWEKIGMLGVIAAGLVVIGVVLGRAKSSIIGSSLLLISFSASMLILMESFKKMDSLTMDIDKIKSLGLIILAIAAICLSARGLNFKTGAGILLVVASLFTLSAVFKMIEKLEWGNITDSLIKMAIIFSLFIIVLKATKLAGEHAAKGGKALISVVIALGMMSTVFLLMSKIKNSTFRKSIKAISSIMLIFSGFIAVSKLAGEHAAKAGAMLLMMSVSMILLTGVISVISLLDAEGVSRGTKAIVSIGVMYGILIAVSKLASNNIKSITMLMSSMISLTVSIAILANVPQEGLKNATVSMASMIAMFSLLMAATKLINDSVKTIVTLGVMVTLLSGVLILISVLPINSSLTTVTALSELMLAMSAAMVIIGLAKEPSVKSLLALASLTLVAAAIGGLLWGLNALKITDALQNTTAISEMLIAMATVTLMLSKFKAMAFVDALAGIGILMIMIAGIGALVIGFGALLQNVTDIEGMLDTGVLVFEKVGEAIGGLIGSLLGSIATSGLSVMADDLTSFIKKLNEGFFPELSKITEDQFDSAKAFAGIIVALSAADLMEGLAKLVSMGGSGNFEGMSKGLEDYGAALKGYGAQVEQIKDSQYGAIAKSATATGYLSDVLTEIPNFGGAAAFFAGDNTWDAFQTGLALYGYILYSYAKWAVLLTDPMLAGISKSATATVKLADALEEVPNFGGALADVVGDNNWTDFQTGLSSYGAALKGYADAVVDLNISAINNSLQPTKDLAAVLKAVPADGGALQKLVGSKNWTTFQKGLKDFGSVLVDYGDIVTGLNVPAVMNSASAAHALADLANYIPTEYINEQEIEWFKESIGILTEVIKTFDTDAKDIDVNHVISVINALSKMMQLITNMPKIPGKLNLFGGVMTIDEFKTNISELANSILVFNAKTANIDSTRFTLMAVQLKLIVDTLNNMANIDVNSVDVFKKAIAEFASLRIDDFSSAFDSHIGEIQNDGSAIISSFIQGIDNKGPDIKTTFDNLSNYIYMRCHAMLSNVSTIFTSYKYSTIGSNIQKGIVSGFSEEIKSSKDEIGKSGYNVLSFIKERLDINSPSKVAKDEIGKHIASGIIEGITEELEMTSPLIKSINKLKETISKSFENISAKINITGNIDDNVVKRVVNSKKKSSRKQGIKDAKEYNKGFISTVQNVIGWGSEQVSNIKEEAISAATNSSIGQQAQNALDTYIISPLTETVTNISGGDMFSGVTDSLNGTLSDAQKSIDTTNTDLFNKAKEKYDDLLNLYKEHKIEQAEYDKQYTALLLEYSKVQTDTIKYSQEQMGNYISETFKKVNDDFESEISGIQQQIDSYKDKIQKTLEEMLTFTTNGDIYNSEISSMEKEISDLEEAKQNTINTYGEESSTVEYYTERIEDAKKALENFKKAHDESGINDDQINNVKFTNKIGTEMSKMEEYITAIEGLKKKSNNSQVIIDMIAGMDMEKGFETVKYLNSLSNGQLKGVVSKWTEYANTNDTLSNLLYGDKMQKATETYIADVTNILENLPTSAKSIGLNMAKGIADGFTEETNASLSRIGKSGNSITLELKKLFDIHSPSRVYEKEIGKNLALGLVKGFVDNAKKSATLMKDSVNQKFNIEPIINPLTDTKGILTNISSILNSDIKIEPRISPILDLTKVQNDSSKINKIISKKEIGLNTIGISNNLSKLNSPKTIDYSISTNSKIPNNNTTTVIQNNYSPKALSNSEIYRNTQQIFNLNKMSGARI